jgi:hypothetical protein
MFRPPPSYIFHLKIKEYEETLGQCLPDWVLTLDRSEAGSLISLCKVMRWKLPQTVLTRGEAHQGKGSLWDPNENTWDRNIGLPKKK